MTALDGAIANHIEPDGIALLKQHLWPGNVRELENLVRRLSLLHAKETITGEDIESQLEFRSASTQTEIDDVTAGFPSLRDATRHFADRYFDIRDSRNEDNNVYQRFLAEFEEPLIVSTLRATNGNQIRAAEILGLNRNTLRKKISTYDIKIVKTVGK